MLLKYTLDKKNIRMKFNMFYIKIVVVAATMLFLGCDSLIRDYELDVDPDLLRDLTLLQYIEEGNDTTLTMYYDAVKHAQMESLFSGRERTYIVPTNNALRNLLNTAGVSAVTDLDPGVVKNLFLYLFVSGEIKSMGIEADKITGFKTLAGDSIYVTRNSSVNDPYRMNLNTTGGFIPSSIQIVKQDYVFKDGVMQIVDVLPVYRKQVRDTDPVPDGVDYSSADKDTIWISEDVAVYQGNKTRNYDNDVCRLVSRSGQVRYTFMKFGVKPITFAENLVSAKLHMNVKKISGSNYVPNCGVFKTHTSWNQTTLVWNNMPEFGAEISSANLSFGWNAIDVTASLKDLYDSQSDTASYGLKSLNGSDIPSSAVEIYNKENSANFPPYISLMSAIDSELQLNVSLPVTITGSDGVALLKKDQLSLSGNSSTYNYTDNNIIYVLFTPPTDGTLTFYGLPMKKNSQFTQEDMAMGAVKYIGKSASLSDSFELKVQDYIGGVYPEHIQILVR